MNGWKCLLRAMAELWVWRISFVSTVSVSLVIACRLNGRKADEFNRDGLYYQFENFRLLYISLVWIFGWKAEHIPSCQGEGSVIEGRCYFVCLLYTTGGDSHSVRHGFSITSAWPPSHQLSLRRLASVFAETSWNFSQVCCMRALQGGWATWPTQTFWLGGPQCIWPTQ